LKCEKNFSIFAPFHISRSDPFVFAENYPIDKKITAVGLDDLNKIKI